MRISGNPARAGSSARLRAEKLLRYVMPIRPRRPARMLRCLQPLLRQAVAVHCGDATHYGMVEAAMVGRISAKLIEWMSRQPLFFQVVSIVVLVTVLFYVLVFMLAVLVEG